ncbi:MAG: sialate O-acetylesterase [Akkermansiaceae bacterium]|jgi:hypothetical protein|tara:strand:+ start:6217 stop:7893 length:1677 start_codon:yes stop_codon:yes gene_type:complete
MKKSILSRIVPAVALVAACTTLTSTSTATAAEKIKKEKLQIVFCFGQSNMVGLASVPTAWYMTQPQYVPPREATVIKSRYFDWNFYWSGARYYQGPKKQELVDLVQARRDSRMKWRQRIRGANGAVWKKEWGEKPKSGRTNVYAFLDQKAEDEGIYKRIKDILDSKENQFTVDDAYNELIARDKVNAAEIKRASELYLKGATDADFDAFNTAVKEAKINPKDQGPDCEKNRAIYAGLAQKHLGLPIAKRTRIFGHGAIGGSEGTSGIDRSTQGPLSVGYGGGITTIGPEYGVGIALEQLIDAPILLVKCSWGNTSIAGAWRTPSLDGVETPIEKAGRVAWDKKMAAEAKKAAREYTPSSAPTKKGELSWCWNQVLPQVDKVLADPGKYYPDYDPKVGYEVAGLVWFQGYSDKDNPAYGELFAALIKDFRKKVKTPKMPVVCGTLGMAGFKAQAFSEGANKGMVETSQMPDLAGTVDVVNTAPYYPMELDLIKQVTSSFEKGSPEYDKALMIRSRATSNKGFHYHGSAKCFILMGDAMGRSLANLIAGGEPTINKALKK